MKKGLNAILGEKGDVFKNKESFHEFEIIEFNKDTNMGSWKCIEPGSIFPPRNKIYEGLSMWPIKYWEKLPTKKKNFNNLYNKLCESI